MKTEASRTPGMMSPSQKRTWFKTKCKQNIFHLLISFIVLLKQNECSIVPEHYLPLKTFGICAEHGSQAA